MDLFNRDFAVTLNTVRISARPVFDRVAGTSRPTLRASFKIVKSTDSTANSAEVSIWNLAPDSRALIQKKNIPCVIEAGYVNNLVQIFSGQLFFGNHINQGTDWISQFQAGDGIEQIRLARVNESFKPGTAVSAVLEHVASKVGVGLGNAMEKIRGGDYRGGITEFTKGITVSGKAVDAMDELMYLTGFEWSIQDGQLQILREDEATEEDAVKLSSSTGMIGSPEFAEDKDKKQFLRVRALLQGTLKPGRLVQVESRAVNGFFKAEKVTHVGDTWSDDWYSDVEARAL